MSSSSSHPYKSGTVAVLSALFLSSAIAPFTFIKSAEAQLFKNQGQTQNLNRTVTIATGTSIPVMYSEAEKILVAKDETLNLTVEVAANLKDRYGQVLVPYGTKIEGRIEPTEDGSQFVAERLIFSENDSQDIYAESRVISRTETIEKGADTGDILKGAAIGAGAAAIISILTGDRSIGLMELIIGGGLGAVGGWVFGGDSAEVIAIEPKQGDLNLVLSDRLSLQPYAYRTPQTARRN